MTAPPTEARRSEPYDVAIVGSDLLLRALPSRPVQVAHGVAAFGFRLVIPASWGDELLAEYAVHNVLATNSMPRVFCACPRVRARLLSAGNELQSRLVSLVAPPVAVARYLRALSPDRVLRITYIGDCEGARDPAIDVRVPPNDFLRHLEARGISLAAQPTVYRDVIPPDRRRYWSLPGGCPSPATAREHVGEERALVRQVDHVEFAEELAECLLAGSPVLVDLAMGAHCSCAGAIADWGARAGRDALIALEPPRATAPVLDTEWPLDLELPPSMVVEGPLLPPTSAEPAVPRGARPAIAPHVAEPPIEPRTTSTVIPHRRAFAVTPPGIAVKAAMEPKRSPGRIPAEALRSARRSNGPRDGPETPPPPQPTTTAPQDASSTQPPLDSAGHAHGALRVARWARSLSAIRVTPEGGVPVTRAYAALRIRRDIAPPAGKPARGETTHGDETTAGDAVVTPSPMPGMPQVMPSEVAHPLAATSDATPSVVSPAPSVESARWSRQLGLAPKAATHRIPPPPRPGSRRLWGLIASVAIMIAIGVLLLLMMGCGG